MQLISPGACIFLAGTALIAFAQNIAMLLVGRALCGSGMCMIQAASPAYVLETCPPLKRGLFSGLYSTVFGKSVDRSSRSQLTKIVVAFCIALAIGIAATKVSRLHTEQMGLEADLCRYRVNGDGDSSSSCQ